MNLDYINDIKIDESALDVEWLRQGELAVSYGKNLVELNSILRKKDENVKKVRSDLIMEANTVDAMEVWNKKKPTQTDIEAYYRTHKKHIEAKEEYLQAKDDVEYAEVVANEIRFTRKAALEQLVTLVISQYTAGPAVPRNLSEEVRKVNAGISEKLNKGASK